MDIDDLLYEDSPDVAVFALSSGVQKQRVLTGIEAVFESFADSLLSDGDSMSVLLRCPPSSPSSIVRERRLYFPGKTADEAWRFAIVVRILEIIHEALCNDSVLSKRDIYYRDPALFGTQYYVDKYVDKIAFTFGVARSALNVTAAAKGLVGGALSLCRRDGSSIDLSIDREGILIPALDTILSVDLKAVQWILVVEKEATFRSLAASEFWNKVALHGVLLTGKGYPDVSTKTFLHFLTTPSSGNGFASPPVYGLMDFDPDGLAILSVYQYGSKRDGQGLRHIRHIGLQDSHVGLRDSVHASQGLLTLSQRDRKKARDMLLSEREEFRQELQTMLLLNIKAELQILDSSPGAMTDLLGDL